MQRICLLFAVTLIFSSCAYCNGTSWPIVKGTFIQEWLTMNWTEKQWDAELAALKEVGMEYLIVAPTGFGTEDGKSLKTIYPSAIKGFTQYAPGVDILENAFRAAKKAGMKVIVGLNMDDSGGKTVLKILNGFINRLTWGIFWQKRSTTNTLPLIKRLCAVGILSGR